MGERSTRVIFVHSNDSTVKDRAYDAINGAHFIRCYIDMTDQVTNRSLEIVLVIEVGSDTQTHILADPNEIAVIAIWNAR
jgi:hypothetical protein